MFLFRISWVLFIFITIPGFAIDFIDDDELIADSGTVSYAGISFECVLGCADPNFDPDLQEIDQLLQTCLAQTINRDPHVIDQWGTGKQARIYWEPEDPGFWIHHRQDLIKKEDFPRENKEHSSRPDPVDSSDHSFLIEESKLCPGALADDQHIILDNHSKLSLVVSLFFEDLRFYHEQSLSYWANRIIEQHSNLPKLERLENVGCIFFEYDEDGEPIGYKRGGRQLISEEIQFIQQEIPRLKQAILYEEENFEQSKTIAEETFAQIDAQFKELFLFCLRHHQPEGIAFDGALEHLLLGDLDQAIQEICELIQIAQEHSLKNDVMAKLYWLKGQVQSECGKYADAIIDLTAAIEREPSLKEVYLDRASVYFELGQFDRALKDYLTSGIKPSYSASPTQWGLGISSGLLEGASSSATEFIPSTLNTLHGLGCGLWAFIQHPVGASKEFIDAAIAFTQYLQSHSNTELLQLVVPEIKELMQGKHLSDFRKGQLIGQVIGKYGVDILLAKYACTSIKAYQNLKRSNQLMTLDSLADSKQAQKILAEANKRWTLREDTLKNGNFSIQWDKQGKHIEGHKNYQQLFAEGKRPSLFVHKKPEALIQKYSGKGTRICGELPGMAGYKEIVDFEEFIGFVVDKASGTKTATTRGTIHYAKDGVHIVPAPPRK